MNENENVPVPEPVLPPPESARAGPADAVAPAASPADPPPEVSGGCGCGCGCGGAGGPRGAGGHVYAVGRVEARFPDLGVEKELEQAVGRADTHGMTDGQAVHTVLNEPANRYLARQMCWVLTIGGIDAYLLVPRDSAEVDLLVETVRPTPGAGDVDVVIGTELTDNTGSTDRHRAVNYLALRYPRIYSAAAAQYAKNCALTGVDTSRSEVSRTRTLIDVVFTYTDRTTNVADRLAARVDVTGMFPFLAAPLSQYCVH
ncbi:cyanobactin maturation protease PatG family protein [Streptomyces zhihengii]